MVEIRVASAAGVADGVNEDGFVVGNGFAVVLDGAGAPEGLTSGCLHGTPWYVRQLGAALARRVSNEGMNGLDVILSESIEDVARSHRHCCDLGHPGSPSSTVVVVRWVGETLDYLVLGDSFLLLHDDTELEVITDDRIHKCARETLAALRTAKHGTEAYATRLREHTYALWTSRNTPGGYWHASSIPQVVQAAVLGSRSTAAIRCVLLATDGVARLTFFGVAEWKHVIEIAERNGPATLIDMVREVERADEQCTRWARTKCYDDATAVLLSFQRVAGAGYISERNAASEEEEELENRPRAIVRSTTTSDSPVH